MPEWCGVLLQIVLEVLGDALVEMDAGMASHIVFLAWIGKEIGLGASLDAGVEEGETVLGNNGVVVVTSNDLKLAFQVLGLADEAALGIAFWVVLRRAHVALAIHDLIPLPIDDRSTSYANLENVRIIGH